MLTALGTAYSRLSFPDSARFISQEYPEQMMATAGHSVEFPKVEALQRLALSDSGFVFDPMTGNSFTVNSTGLAILRQLQKGVSLDGLLKALPDEFEVDPLIAERDVIEFADLLRNQFK
jgi:hypothetical protein